MVVLIVWGLASRVLRLLVHATPLRGADRVLGAAFGLLRGVVLLLVLATVVALTPAATSPAWHRSQGVLAGGGDAGAQALAAAGHRAVSAGLKLKDTNHVRHRRRHLPAPVNQLIYDALLLLQHRGQDAAGIVTMQGTKCFMHKARGMVRDVFRTRNMRALPGNVGLGQVRYPTAGNAYSEEEAQPFYVNAPFGIVLVHNGNLTNAQALKRSCSTSTAATSTPRATPRC